MAVRTVRTLAIRLGEANVGHLAWFSDARSVFQFDEEYQLRGPDRPVLSLAFTDPGKEEDTVAKLARPYARTVRLPSYFRNLLPEAALRELMARKLGTTPDDEFGLLQGLGKNLPGAVLAIHEETPERIHKTRAARPRANEHMKSTELFSLGGAQLKLTMIKRGATFSVKRKAGAEPASEWIIKPPHPTFDRVPENEYGMLSFARSIGIDTPEAKLVSLKQLELGDEGGIQFARGEKLAYAIKRFDRTDDGGRIHTEDFAQAFGVDPEDEYRATNYDSVGNLIFHVLPDPFEQLAEFIRRLTFMIMIGNSDAHLKNWSIIYRDGRTPQLSPAYDLVSTIPYVPSNRSLALNLRREKEFARLTVDHFARMANRIGAAPEFVTGIVGETVERARSVWKETSRSMPDGLVAALRRHWKTLDEAFRI